MNMTIDAVARVLARRRGRLVPVRRTSALSSDPGGAFGIVMIKVVSEEVVQGIGYGRWARHPRFSRGGIR